MKRVQTAAFGVPEYELKGERAYRPRLTAVHLRRLWQLKQRTGRPIAKLVAEALDAYLESNR